MDKDELIVQLEGKIVSLKTAINDIKTSGTPERIALAWRWGSTTFVFGANESSTLATTVLALAEAQLSDLENQLNSLNNG